MLTPPTKSGSSEKTEAFKLMSEVAAKCRDLPMSGRKMAVLMALEERAREMGLISDNVTLDDEFMPTVMTKPSYRVNREVLESLSANPANLKYHATQRLLDDCDDDVDEIGVSLPEDYGCIEDKGQENMGGKVAEEKGEAKEPATSKTSQKAAKKSESKNLDGSLGGKGAGMEDKMSAAGEEKGRKGGKLAVEYEDHLRKVEDKLRESHEDFARVDSGLTALLAEFRRNLLGSDVSRELGSENEEYLARKEDLKSVWIGGGKEEAESSRRGDKGGGAELFDQDWYNHGSEEELDDEEGLDDEEEEEGLGEESLEEGVSSSWYSISETPAVGASTRGKVKEDDEVQGT